MLKFWRPDPGTGCCGAAISLSERIGGPLVLPGLEIECQEEGRQYYYDQNDEQSSEEKQLLLLACLLDVPGFTPDAAGRQKLISALRQ